MARSEVMLAGGEVQIHDAGDAFHHFIAKMVIVFALLAEDGAVKENGAGGGDGTGGEGEVGWIEKPGPAEGAAGFSNAKRGGPGNLRFGVEFGLAIENQVKAVGGFALAVKMLTGGKTCGHGGASKDFEMGFRETMEERMGGDQGGQGIGGGAGAMSERFFHEV